MKKQYLIVQVNKNNLPFPKIIVDSLEKAEMLIPIFALTDNDSAESYTVVDITDCITYRYKKHK